jgi:hypothetical protein
MVLIIKKKNEETYYVARLAKFGYGPDIRLINLIKEDDNLDKRFIRIRLYKAIIDKLVSEGRWNRTRSYQEGDVPNTMHDWLVAWFNETKASTLFIEVGDDVCNKSVDGLEDLLKQINL